MKRILAVTLTLVMLLAALTGCMASMNPSGKEGEQNPSSGHLPIILTIAETEPSCPAFESDCFYAFDTEGILYRVLWTDFEGLHEKDTVAVEYSKKEELNIPADLTGGFHAKYEITANNVKKDINHEDYLVSHIQIKSGENTIHPFGYLVWSQTDHGDGYISEMHADRLDMPDVINRNTDAIPTLVLEERVSYLVQVNGSVENVYLYTPNGDGYTKSETTFDALSNLADGTYYVVLEVLLSGNCDPDAPQNSYRYQDIFCLVVGEDDKPVTSEMITYSSGDVLSQTVLNNAEKQIILNILDCDKEWISDIPECDWICRFSSSSVNIGYCDCGTLSDFINNRSRKLTDEEKENIESLISQLNEEQLPSGYEVEVELFQDSDSAWMSFVEFEGTEVFKLKCKSKDQAIIVYSGKLEAGSLTVYYDCGGTKTELFSLQSGEDIQSAGGYLPKDTIYIIVETSEKCSNGNLSFEVRYG